MKKEYLVRVIYTGVENTLDATSAGPTGSRAEQPGGATGHHTSSFTHGAYRTWGVLTSLRAHEQGQLHQRNLANGPHQPNPSIAAILPRTGHKLILGFDKPE